jgi:hypothetical protein
MAKGQSTERRRAPKRAKSGKVRGSGPSNQMSTAWERLSGRTQHAVGIVALLLVSLGFLWSVTFGGFSLVGSDIVQWRGMAESMYEYEAETGSRALWAPNAFGGMPGYLIHYPKEVIQIDTVVTALRAMGWWPGAHLFVLLLGTYLLVFYLSRDVLASVLAGIAYGLTTYIPIILIAGHNTKFIAMAFAPWLVLTFLYAFRRPPGAGWLRVLLGSLLFAAALAINLRAEHVQITYYVIFALGVVWIVEGIGAIREGEWKPFLISTASLAVGGLLALAMVAQPYMATAEYKQFTIRAAVDGGLAWDYAMNWSQGFGELITLLIPGAYGGEGMTYWGPKPFTAGPHYVGPLVLLLAGLAMLGVRRRLVTGLGVAAGIMVLFSLGRHFPLLNRPMFDYFPLFSSFRVPETWLAVVALSLAVLAGAGAYYLGRREPTPEGVERKTRAAYLGVGGIGGLLLLLLIGHGILFSFEAPGEMRRFAEAIAQQSGVAPSDPRVEQAAAAFLADVKSERRSLFLGDTVRALAFLLLGGVLIFLQRTRRIPSWTLQLGLILLVTVDLWQVGSRYFNTASPSIRTTGQVERAIPQYGFDRFIQARVEVAGGPGHFRTLPLALNPFNDGRTPFFYESVGGYHGAKLALFQDYIDYIFTLPNGALNPNALDLMGARFVIAQGLAPGFEVAFRDEQTGLMVLEKPDVLPRAFFVDEYEVIADDAAAIERLQDPALDLRRTALLTEVPDFPELSEAPARQADPSPIDRFRRDAAPAEADTAAAPALDREVSLVRYTPREIVWEVKTDVPRLFVASEVYYPAGWIARIDGDEMPIYRANHLLRAVPVPAGQHLLTMRFEPEVHPRSVRITLIATSLVYLALLVVTGLWWYRGGRAD